MISTPANNVIDLHTGEPLNGSEDELQAFDGATQEHELQLWSALTLSSLQKQLTGHEDDPRFSEARRLVDELARQFASSDPLAIADYFEAISALAALKEDGLNRLDELEAFDPLAA